LSTPIRRIAGTWISILERWRGKCRTLDNPYGLRLLQGQGGEAIATCREPDFHLFLDGPNVIDTSRRIAFRLKGYDHIFSFRERLEVELLAREPRRIDAVVERFNCRTKMRKSWRLEALIVRTMVGAPTYLRTHDGPHPEAGLLLVIRPRGATLDRAYITRLLTDDSYARTLESPQLAATVPSVVIGLQADSRAVPA